MTLKVVGVLERRQPLPPGRYWISVTSSDSAPDRMTHFIQWTAANAQTVIVDKMEPLGGPRDPKDPGLPGKTNGLFCIFTVLLKTTFDQKQFGFPNVAGPEVQTSNDTVQRPPKPTSADMIADLFGDLFSSPIGKLALIGGLAYLFSRSGRQ